MDKINKIEKGLRDLSTQNHMKTLVSYKNPLPYKNQGTRTLNREDPGHRTL